MGSKDLGKFTLIHHRINTFDEEPVRERLRHTPLMFQKEEEKTLTDMLEAQVIKPSTYAHVLVRTKDGEVRYSVDYRQLNVKTIKPAYYTALIEECTDSLSGTLWFLTRHGGGLLANRNG